MLWLQVWRDLRSHASTFLFSVLTMALGIGLMVGFSAAYQNLGRSTEETYQRLQFLDLSCHVRNGPASLVERVLELEGVAAAEARRSLGVHLVLADGERLNGLALGLPEERSPTVNKLHVLSGSSRPPQRGQVLLEARFARAYGYRPGDWLTVEAGSIRRRFCVTGLVSSPEFLWLAPERLDPRPAARRFGVLWLCHRDVSALSGMDVINEIHLKVKPGYSPESLRPLLLRRLEAFLDRPIETRQQQPSHSLLERDRLAFAAVSAVFPLLLLALSGMVLFVSLWQLLHAQRKSIGVLLCLGMSRARIGRQYAALTLILCLLGSALGCLLGPTLAQLACAYYVETLSLPLQLQGVPLSSLLGSCLLALGVGGLACSAALSHLLQQQPVDLLHQEFSSRPAFLPPGWVRHLALPWRNLLRNPGRTLTMLLGTCLATALVLMTLALLDSEKTTLDFYLARMHRYDLKVDLAGLPTSNDMPPVQGWAGVERVERGLLVEALLRYQNQSYTCGIWGLPADSRLLQLHGLDGQPLQPQRGQGLLLPPLLRRRLGLSLEGQSLCLELANGRIRGIEQKTTLGPALYEPIAGPVKCEISDLQRCFAHGCDGPSQVYNVLLLRVTPARLGEVLHRLHQDSRVRKVETMRTLREDLDNLLRMVNAYFSLMVLCSSLMAVAVLHLCTLLNLRERRCEVALMLAQGVRRGQVLGLLARELSALWLLGSVLGLGLGRQAGNWLLQHYQSDLIDLRLQLLPQSFLTALCLSGLTLLLAAWRPLQQLLSPQLAQTLRSPE